MHIHNILHGLILSTTVTYAFIPCDLPKLSSAMSGDGKSGNHWKPVKKALGGRDVVLRERDAKPFVPVMPPVRVTDIEGLEKAKWDPVEPRDEISDVLSLKLKKHRRTDDILHPEIRHVQRANSVTRKYRRRGLLMPDVDEKLAIRKVVESIQRRAGFVQSHDPSIPDSMAINQDGQDFSYFAEVNFGSSNKTFRLVLDTGSSVTWIASSNCSSPACRVHKTFSDQDSSTLQSSGRRFSIKYGSGQVEFVVVTDDISFAGFRINTEFGLAQVLSSDFTEFPIDGIMGLSFKESLHPIKTVMDSLVDNGLIKNKLFAIALSRAEDNFNDGVVNFGGVDGSYFTGNLSFSQSVSQHGLWEIEVGDMGHDGMIFDFPNRTAVIDTGTSLLLLPYKDALAVHSVILGAQTNGQHFAIPCSTNTSLEFTFNGVTYKIPATDWVGEVLDQSQNLCLSYVYGRELLGPTVWLLGDVFLKNVYSVFDMDHNRVGFGMRKSPTTQSGTSPSSSPTDTGYGAPTISSTSAPTHRPKGGNGSPFDMPSSAYRPAVLQFGCNTFIILITAFAMVL